MTEQTRDNVVPLDPSKKRKRPTGDDGGSRTIDSFIKNQKMVRDPSGRMFGVFGGELIPTDTPKFLDRLSFEFHAYAKKTCSRQQIEKALAVVRGDPAIKSVVVPYRYAYDKDGAIWIDAVNHAVRIDSSGVRVFDRAPHAFFRPEGVQAHPKPEVPHDDATCRKWLDALCAHLQLDRQGRRVAFAWLIAAMRPTVKGDGELMRYPILAACANHGGGKTSKTDTLRALVDHRLPLHCDMPGDARNLAILGENQHVLSFDNVSAISPTMSDGLCRRATGDAYESREYYTTRGLSNLRGSNPQILNTIVDTIFHAPDLQSRALLLNFPTMKKRLADERVAKNFKALWPKVQGALYYCVARALRDLKMVRPAPSDIRMASAATWAIAASSAAGFTRSDIIRAYRRTRDEADAIALERPLPAALLDWMRKQKKNEWRGPARKLLQAISVEASDVSIRGRDWPQTPHAMRGALKRLEPVLTRAGVSFDWARRGSYERGGRRNFGLSWALTDGH